MISLSLLPQAGLQVARDWRKSNLWLKLLHVCAPRCARFRRLFAHTHVYSSCAGVQARFNVPIDVFNYLFCVHLSAGEELDRALSGDEVVVDLRDKHKATKKERAQPAAQTARRRQVNSIRRLSRVVRDMAVAPR